MARFVSHPLGVDLLSVFITLKPSCIKAPEAIRRLSVTAQNGNTGQELFPPLCGIFAPAFRASLRPMATACLRLFTFPPVPPLPDFNVPRLYSCMTFPTLPMPLVDELVFAVAFLGVLSFALGIY